MALRAQNLPNQSDGNVKTGRKNFRLQLEQSAGRSPFCEETERLFMNNNKQLSSLHSDLDMRQTERNYSKSKQKMVIWLTQSNSSKSEKESNWSPNLESAHKQQIDEIYSVLEDHQLMEVFEAFEQLRSVIADELYDPQTSKTYNFTLLQAIQTFKVRIGLAKIEQQVLFANSKIMPKDVKDLLQKITNLRSENACLKQKMQKLRAESQRSERETSQSSNSLLNNSISFHSCNSIDSLSNSELSFEVAIEKEFVRPFLVCKEAREEQVSTMELLSNSGNEEATLLQSSTINCINSFVITPPIPNHQQTQTQPLLLPEQPTQQNEWTHLVSICILNLKKLFTFYRDAVNLALISNRVKLNQFNLLLGQVKAYRSTSIQATPSAFMKQCSDFAAFLMDISHSLNQIIESSFAELEVKPMPQASQ